MENLSIYKEAKKIWKKIARDGSVEELEFDLAIHKKLLSIFQAGDFYYFIFDIKHSQFAWISPELEKLLGYTPQEMTIDFFLGQIHPDDQPWFLNFENAVHEFFRSLPLSDLLRYKIRYDFRIKNKQGDYTRILHQMVILQHDDEGNLLKSFGVHTDISHLKKTGKPLLSFIGLEDAPSYVDVNIKKKFIPVSERLTKREKEIVKLMIEGHQSKSIAQHLHISPATVDKHRKNMLQRMGASTTAQLIARAINEGWI